MTKFNKLQNSFSSGLLGPKLRGRTDLKQYFAGCETLQNMTILPTGGVSRRVGMQYLSGGPSVFSIGNKKLIPFRITNSEQYQLVVYSDGGLVVASIFRNGFPQIGSVTFVTTGMSSAEKDDVNGWNYAQYGEALILCHRSGKAPPHVLKRLGVDDLDLVTYENSWFITDLKKALSVPYLPTNNTGITLTPSATTGAGIFIDSSAAFFDPTNHVGAYFRIVDTGGNDGIVKLIANAGNSSTRMYADVVTTLGGTNSTEDWQESAWSNYQGWPKTVAVFEQRLVFGGTPKRPDSVDFSRLGNVFQMMGTKLIVDASSDVSGLGYFGDRDSTDGFSVTIGNDVSSEITFLVSFETLIIGTATVEWEAGYANILAFNDIQFRKKTMEGSANIRPSLAGSSIFFISLDGKRIFKYSYNSTDKVYTAIDVSLLNDTIRFFGSTEDTSTITFTSIVFHRAKKIVWALTSTGRLIGLTVNDSSEVTGWHPHETDGEILSIETFYNIDNIEELWLLVKRDINGTDTVFLERMSEDFEAKSLLNSSTSVYDKPIYLDCSKFVRGASFPLLAEDGSFLLTEDGKLILQEST